ncbi:25591_t:CDS:2, partial [Gigaspora rosea]
STFSKKQRNMQDQEAPLILGFDIKKIPPYAKAMALNTEIITVNQVPLGKSVYNKYDEIWTGPLNDVFLFNRRKTLSKIILNFTLHCGLKGEITLNSSISWCNSFKALTTNKAFIDLIDITT